MKKLKIAFKKTSSINKNNCFKIILVCFILMNSCGKEDCNYLIIGSKDNIPVGCTLSNSINLSSGLDANGNLIVPGDGIIDSYWKVLNNPPLISCKSPLSKSINGNAYVINFAGFSNDQWVNQPTASTLAPIDLGTTNGFGCNNATNSLGIPVPYVFERSFCVLKNTSIGYNFTYKGDDQIYFELINNISNEVINTSLNYIYPDVPFIWSASAIPLSIGSYSLRGYLINTSSVVLGFSISGNLTTTNNDLAISNNAEVCCENNTISIVNILESNCDGVFNATDQFGSNWTFNLQNASNVTIRTAQVNENGNIFFSGLANGTYTITAVAQDGWIASIPSNGTTTISVTNNTVRIVEFYNCR